MKGAYFRIARPLTSDHSYLTCVNAPLTFGFAQPLIDVPRPVGIELFRKLDEIVATLNGIPRDSTIWRSLLESWLVLRIGDWRFQYRIDPERNRLMVLTAAKANNAA